MKFHNGNPFDDSCFDFDAYERKWLFHIINFQYIYLNLCRYILISIIILTSLKVEAQFSFIGTTQDEKGKALPSVNIKLKSSNQIFRSDAAGAFSINSAQSSDSLFFSLEGYETSALLAVNKQAIQLVMKKLPAKVNKPRNELHSYIQNTQKSFKFWTFNNETYTSLVENPFVPTGKYPVSSFSLNTNRASYSNIRRFINENELVPPDAVRIEEMLNYFKFSYEKPSDEEVFNLKSELTDCPWNSDHKLLFLNISAKELNTECIPPNNLVFLLDISGSMDLPKKLPLIKAGMKLLIQNLRPVDTVSLVTYGGRVKTVLEGMSGNEKDIILKAIDSLVAGGDTPGEAAIKNAYRIVRKRLNKESNNRIILATDGDFNVGSNSEKDLANLIESQKNAGIYLTCVGVGMGNYKDSKLSVLAQTGNGNFAYIDNEMEAEKVFFTEFAQTMYTVADGAYVKVDMDSMQVQEYRLIGYDNKRNEMKDTSKKITGGEIGSGQTTTAIYEITPKKLNGEPIALANVHYRIPGTETEMEPIRFRCSGEWHAFETLHPNFKKSACITQFGLKLKMSEYISKKVNWKKTLKLAEKYFDKKIPVEKEFILMIEKTRKLYRKKIFGLF